MNNLRRVRTFEQIRACRHFAFRVPQIFKVASTLHFSLSYSCKVYSQSLASLDNY